MPQTKNTATNNPQQAVLHTTNLTLQKFQENFDFIESKNSKAIESLKQKS